jgi:hypothetical protein
MLARGEEKVPFAVFLDLLVGSDTELQIRLHGNRFQFESGWNPVRIRNGTILLQTPQ